MDGQWELQAVLENYLGDLWCADDPEQRGCNVAIMQLADYLDAHPTECVDPTADVLESCFAQVWMILHDSDHLVPGATMGAFALAYWSALLGGWDNLSDEDLESADHAAAGLLPDADARRGYEDGDPDTPLRGQRVALVWAGDPDTLGDDTPYLDQEGTYRP